MIRSRNVLGLIGVTSSSQKNRSPHSRCKFRSRSIPRVVGNSEVIEHCRKAIHSHPLAVDTWRFSYAKSWRGRIMMQRGSLAMVSRKEAPGVWQFRWSEKDLHGVRVQRKRVIGSVERYPNETAARSAVTVLLAEINSDKVRMGSRSITRAQLCDHFEQRELAWDNTWRSYATK